MANIDKPQGLKPVKMADGSDYTGASAIPCFVPSSDSTALYIGDPVIVTGDGNSADVGASGSVGGAVGAMAGTLPIVTRATNGDGNRITGVVTRVGFNKDDYARPAYRKASTDAVVWVEMDPQVLYEIQGDGSNTVADVGLNAVLTGTGGDTSTGLSSVELDSDAVAADASNQLLIVSVSRDPLRNDISSANCAFYVKLNQLTQDPDSVLGIS